MIIDRSPNQSHRRAESQIPGVKLRKKEKDALEAKKRKEASLSTSSSTRSARSSVTLKVKMITYTAILIPGTQSAARGSYPKPNASKYVQLNYLLDIISYSV